MKIGYLGPKGTFSEQAFKKYKSQQTEPVEGIEARSFFDLFMWVSEGECDKIIVPIENSVEGNVTTTLDLLTHTDDIYIQQEINLPILNYLLGFDQDLSKIDHIFSHSQPLAQCQHYIHKNFPHVHTVPLSSTRAAADMVMKMYQAQEKNDQGIYYAIIGNKQLTEIFPELQILSDQPINDYPSNMTRFLIIGKTPTKSSGYDKTSIVFSMEKDHPGGLYEVLGEFTKNNINLTKITSRPTKEVLGEYLFFIDFEGHVLDNEVKETLEKIAKITSLLKVLGSYQRGD